MGLSKNGLVLDSISDAGRRQKAKYGKLLCEINIMYEVGNNILVSFFTLNGLKLPIEMYVVLTLTGTFLYAIF